VQSLLFDTTVVTAASDKDNPCWWSAQLLLHHVLAMDCAVVVSDELLAEYDRNVPEAARGLVGREWLNEMWRRHRVVRYSSRLTGIDKMELRNLKFHPGDYHVAGLAFTAKAWIVTDDGDFMKPGIFKYFLVSGVEVLGTCDAQSRLEDFAKDAEL
jgi:hypothetical protein